MEFKKARVSIKLTEKEQKTFAEMIQFTREFHEKANRCDKLNCAKCPLNIFCGCSDDDEYRIEEAHKTLEDFEFCPKRGERF